MTDIPREFSVKVDNLPLHADKFQLREAFRACGDVADVYIPRDRAYGFVRFWNQEDAEAAQEQMDGVELGGRNLRVNLAKDKDFEASRKRAEAEGEAPPASAPPPKRSRGGAQGPCIFKCLGSEHVVSAIIGKGGNALRELQEETGAKLEFSSRGVHFPETRCRAIAIRAENSEQVGQVLDSIVERIQEAATSLDDEPSKGRFPGDCRAIALVARFVAGSLLGKGGEDMRRLQGELQCYIEVEKSSVIEGHQRVEIRGDVAQVKRALRVVNDKVQAEVHRDWFPGWASQDPLAGILPVPGERGERGGRHPEGSGRGEGDRGRERARGRQVPLEEMAAPPAEDLAAFRDRYPMDDRAWQYFTSSSGAIQVKVLQDFRPKPLRDTDEDFSALLTSFVASVAKRFADNPSGFRKGLGGGGRDADEEPSGRSSRAVSPPPEAERPPTRDATGFTQTLNDIPLKYLGYDYAICCDLPVDRCKPIRRCMDEVGKSTHTQIELFGPEAEGTQRLHITGRLPDVYTAHLRLMWEFNAGEDKPEIDPELLWMHNQIAELQAQLDSVRGTGPGPNKPPGNRGGKGRNGRR